MTDRLTNSPTDSDSGPRYLRTKAAAKRSGLSPRTLEAYRIHGDGPPYIKYGGEGRGLVLYEQAELDAWIAERRRTSTSDRGQQ